MKANLFESSCVLTCTCLTAKKIRTQVLRFCDGAHLRSIGTDGRGAGQFSRPFDVCVSGEHLLVADTNNHRVQVLTMDGAHVHTIGSEGNADGLFVGPSALCMSPAGDRLFVVEAGDKFDDTAGGHRVQMFSA